MRHDEDVLQIQIFEYLNLRGIFAFHPKNSGRKSIQSAMRDKKLGVKAGIPDIVIIDQNGITRYIELKTDKGRLSEAQLDFKMMCQESQRMVSWALCRSLDEVIETLEEWGVV